MNVFKNTNNKTAKDHITQKRNRHIYVDLINNSTTNKLGCVKSNKVTRFNNHSNLLNLTHGFHDYYQSGKCRDICNNFLSDEYDTEIFRNKICNVSKNTNTNNADVSHNYTGMILTDDKYPNNSIIDFSKNTITHYTNVTTSNGVAADLNTDDYFKYKSKKKRTKCFKINTNNIIIE
jgi:hypothetical protein